MPETVITKSKKERSINDACVILKQMLISY